MINIKNHKGTVVSSLVGGVIGATASLLLTPKTGREVRSKISTQSGKFANQCKSMTHSAKGQFSNFKNSTSNKTKNLRNKFKKNENKNNELENHQLETSTDDDTNEQQTETMLRFEPTQSKA